MSVNTPNEDVGSSPGNIRRDYREHQIGRLAAAHRPNYDCVIGNIVTAAGWLGVSLNTPLASILSLEPKPTPVWNLEASSLRQLEVACAIPCLDIEEWNAKVLPPPGRAAVLIGDGNEMPWSPYFGNESLEHSFLVVNYEGEHLAFDSYQADTDWGVARPIVIEHGDWAGVPVARTLELSCFSGPETYMPARRAYVSDDSLLKAYKQAVVTETQPLSQLAIDTWLISRARQVNMNAVNLSENGLRIELARSQEAWASAAESVYMALRRVRRGRPASDSYKEIVMTAVACDVAVAELWEE